MRDESDDNRFDTCESFTDREAMHAQMRGAVTQRNAPPFVRMFVAPPVKLGADFEV